MEVLTSVEIGISAPLLNRSLLRGGNCGAGSVERKIIDGQTYRHDFVVYTVSLISVKTRVAPPVLVSDQRELTRSTLAMTSHLLSSSCWKVSISFMLARKSYMYRRKAHSADQASATPCKVGQDLRRKRSKCKTTPTNQWRVPDLVLDLIEFNENLENLGIREISYFYLMGIRNFRLINASSSVRYTTFLPVLGIERIWCILAHF